MLGHVEVERRRDTLWEPQFVGGQNSLCTGKERVDNTRISGSINDADFNDFDQAGNHPNLFLHVCLGVAPEVRVLQPECIQQ